MDKIVSGIIIGTLLICVMLFFCVILIRLYFTKIKKYTQALYAKDLEYQRLLQESIIETQEEVLLQISQDLHDDAGQQLTYINLQLERLKLENEALQSSLDPISLSVMHLSDSIRSISRSLNNQLIVQQDLWVAMATAVDRIRKLGKHSIALTFLDTETRAFHANEKIIIYRIFQELLNNALKHSKADMITIRIQKKPTFKMEFQDNGIGFLPEKASEKKVSLGLLNMQKRAAAMHYNLTIDSVIGKGTTIILAEQ